jgi:hypothetical protein
MKRSAVLKGLATASLLAAAPRTSLRATRFLLLASMLALLPTAALADETAASPAEEPWEFTIGPYGWALGLAGEINPGGNRIDVDLSFSEILDDLQFAAFTQFTARKGPWFIAFDGWGAILDVPVNGDMTAVGFGPTTIQDGALSISIPSVQTTVGPLKTDTRLNLIMLELGGGYRVFSEHLFGNSENLVNLDLYAGGRLWRMHTETDLSMAPVTIPGFDVSGSLTPPSFPNRPIDLGSVEIPGLTTAGIDETVESTSWWIDPVIGIRLTGDVTDRIMLGFVGNIGGFGIGSASEFTWFLEGSAGYQLGESWTVVLGYRANQINRSSEAFEGKLYGPIFRAEYRWGGRPS